MITHTLNASSQELVLTFPGDLLSTNANELNDEITSLCKNGESSSKWNTLTLDLKNARMIDSIGLNLLVCLVKDIKEKKGQLKALITSRTIYRTFLATRLDRSIEVVFNER
ncbi:MAG: STAS domain-containing protein [Verrucomicrobiota bacterium]